MAITKPLIFREIVVADADGSNGIGYPIHLSESAQAVVTPVFNKVDDGQSLPARFSIEFEAVSFNTNLYNESRVYSNTAAEPVYATLMLLGAPGSQNLNIVNSLVSAFPVFDGDRTGIKLTTTKDAVSQDTLVQMS